MAKGGMSPEQDRSLERVRANLVGIGYGGGLLENRYRYSDWFSDNAPERTVPLAAFGQTPVSFDNACFAVVTSNGEAGVDRIRDCRALGAPRAFEIDRGGQVFHWRVGRNPTQQDRQKAIRPHEIDGYFRQHAEQFEPEEMLRAKHIGPSGPRQQDFIDLGLMPAIEQSVREKIDPLLREVLHDAQTAYVRKRHKAPNPASLFQLVFRALTGKIMHDRGIRGFTGFKQPPDADDFLERVAVHYNELQPTDIQDRAVRQVVLDRLWAGVNLKNVSVETLAYVWENTLLTRDLRRARGIHGTPPSVARYIVRRLPISRELALRGVFVEPCCGAATFLVAMMQRLRELLPREMDGKARHQLFKNNLFGFDTDSFGIEVAKCRLMLADFPHPNQWGVMKEDVFGHAPLLRAALRRAAVVLCNPPFGTFTPAERKRYEYGSVYKPVELMGRVLDAIPPDAMLGFVMPLQLLSGQSYKSARVGLAERFSDIEVVSLPDRGVFEWAEQESVLVIAHGGRPATRVSRLLHRRVDDGGWPAFRDCHAVTSEASGTTTPEDAEINLALTDLPEVWAHLARLPRLKDVADSIRRGIEWNIPLDKNRNELIRPAGQQTPKGFKLGIPSPPRDTFHAYQTPPVSFLCMEPRYQLYKAFDLPWDQPKAVMSAKRKSRSPWRIAAFADRAGLVCYQTLTSVWPAVGWPPEVIAAILNSPVANAYVATREGNRDITNEIVADIPVPLLSRRSANFIASLVKRYTATIAELPLMNPHRDAQARGLLLQIDAAVLKSYGLPAKLERAILAYFAGSERDRPVSVSLPSYTVADLDRAYAEIAGSLEPVGEGPSESWEELKVALDKNRSPWRKLFP